MTAIDDPGSENESGLPVRLRRIALHPSLHAEVRRATRVIAMVHELHKAGYQRMRICPAMAPSGEAWRCPVTTADNIESDGFSIRDFDVDNGLVAPYTSADGDRYFGWSDVGHLSAREMASCFLDRFPVVAAGGAGRDWAYAGWLTEVLGRAEQGQHADLPDLYGDHAGLDPSWLPTPLRSVTSLS